MTAAQLAERLVRHGLPSEEIAAKTQLFDRVLSHASSWQRSNVHAWWIPGRLEVFGKHTDYAGGRTLVGAVPRGFAVLARPRTDGIVHVFDAQRQQQVSVPTASVTADSTPHTGWRRYVEVVARRLARNFPDAPIAADVVIASDLPRASGMSSSSALLIGIASALVRAGSIDERTEWRANISGPLDLAGYYACIENGSSFGSLEGDTGVGTHGGSEDHAAILTGAAAHLSAFAFVPMRPFAAVVVPEQWRFVLTPSGVPAQKAGAAREAYNMLSERTSVLLELWNARAAAERAPSLAAALASPAARADGMTTVSTEAADRLRMLVRRNPIAGYSPDSLEKRLDHFIREDARVAEALDGFRSADAGRLGRLAEGSQRDAEELLGNQIPQTSALARTARDLGAFAACSFGAGFGGSLWTLIERERADEFARHWHRDAFPATPGPPLLELTAADE
jgi:galactokinase